MNLETEGSSRVQPEHTETYVAFRSAIPKPPSEETHLRHILRFYIARALQKRGPGDIYVLPEIDVGDRRVSVDVVAALPEGRYIVAICEPESVTQETEDLLELFKDMDDVEVIVVYSQYGESGSVMERFQQQLESGKFHLLTVVPPPFDDVYEYDIWMFETTFRNIFERE
ncbi:MAG TPA: hypothetical protein ENI92_10115 [Bacteroidetes bacterium]|nr:hypothetical protein [Bacteroidota bacterium]